MAYGVKFRLDFDDVLGNGKRLEILQDSYTGDVKSLVGSGDPVVIKWDADDDIYSPIIGSTCTINLFQTDDTDYDSFFNADEREYKVVINAAQTVSDIYKERVQQDGGFIEAKSCIDSTITGYYDTASYFNKRVLDDGGVTESLDCIGEVLTLERRNIFTTYWAGWLVTDQYTEVMAPNPQPVTLKAIDALGELNAYTPSVDTDSRILDYLVTGLNNLNLDLDVYVNNDIRHVLLNIFGNDFYFNIEKFNGNNISAEAIDLQLFDDKYEFFNYKELIETLLLNINARVYQSNGKWVIANNSTYSEIRVQDDIQNILQDGGTLPTDIEQRRLNYLKQNVEFTSFRKYNYSTLNETAYKEQALNKIKYDVTPLDQSLVREFERGFKEIEVEVENTRVIDKDRNTSFEYGNTGYTISYGSIVSNDIRKTGIKSFKSNMRQFSSGNPSITLFSTDYYIQDGGAERKIETSYYFDTGNVQQTSASTGYFWYNITAFNGSSFRYYNTNTNAWSSTVSYQKIEFTKDAADKWVNQSINIPPDTASTFNGPGVSTNLTVYAPYAPFFTNYQNIYIDNVAIRQNTSVSTPNLKASRSKYTLLQSSTTNSVIDNKKYKFQIGGGNVFGGVIGADYTRYEPNFLISNAYQLPYLREVVLRQQLNDYRGTLTRYEGTLYNNNSQPLSMLSKVWVNFGENILQENNSCIMDGLEYNVKRNTYNVIMHTSNQDNDVSATFEDTTESVVEL
jgi:hypothetical protein